MRTNQKIVSNGNFSYRVIAFEIIIIGMIIFIGGIVMIKAGNIGVHRMNQATGKLIRIISNQDKHYYSLLKSLIGYGKFIRVLGAIIMFPGFLFSVKPFLLYTFFNKFKLDKISE